MKLSIKDEERDLLLEKIKGYFLEHRDEEIGDLQAMLLLDFFVTELAPAFYNQGISNSITWLSAKLEDMHELEIQK